MPSTERDASRDGERYLKHQHSASSDGGRAIIPMWDSSDPERAPPPLPMNPSSPSIAASRPNASSAIQSAHAALTEKARESAYITNPITKRIEPSPERSLIKGAAHKRMQSLHTGNVRDLSSFLEGGSSFGSPRSPDKPTNRPATPHANKELTLERKSPEKEKEKESNRSPTPTSSRDTPQLRPSLRRPPQSILGENTPPQSATMLALQNMATRDMDAPLSTILNGSSALVRTPQTFDAISNQILSLTSIATSLQREMAQLSRRSKDNATDLVSLKEATNARDEDIRKSLRELVSNLSEPTSRSSSNLYGGAGFYLDNKAHISQGSRATKAFSLPRIPSPNSFASTLDRESVTTPSLYNDGAASIALLEKILREMGTKEGQDLLISRLTEVADRLTRDGMSTAKKLEDLVLFIKTNTSQDLVSHDGGGGKNSRPRNFSFAEPPRLELDFDQPRSGPMTQRVEGLLGMGANKENARASGNRAAEVVNEEILKIIRAVKDSVAQGGGLTAEVKALVRELRGEVLGMGRQIGRKLDEAARKSDAADGSAEKEHVTRVVQDGLEELKQHMDRVLRESRRQSSSSSASRNTVDYEEIYNAVRTAVNEKRNSENPALEKEDIIEAVREAWENYKPEIELQHFGLEREELLACLKEGIQEYAPKDNGRSMGGATREEVFKAVVEGLKHFSPPRVETAVSLTREEILEAVRECLEEFEFPCAPPPEPREIEITRDDMLDAVKEGLSNFDFAANTMALTRDTGGGLTKDDLYDAVKAGLQDAPPPMDTYGEQVLERLQEIEITRDDMLHAVKEGLSNFDFAANTMALTRDNGGGLTKDDLYDAVKAGLQDVPPPMDAFGEQVLERLQEIEITRDDMLNAVKEGLSNFDFAENTMALTRDTGGGLTKDDLYDAVKAGLQDAPPPMDAFGEQVLERLHQIMESMHSEFKDVSDEAKQNVAAHGRDTEQVLDATKDGFEKLRADIESYVDRATDVVGKDEILDMMRDSFDTLRAEVEGVVSKGSETSLESVQSEFEHLREMMATSCVRGGTGVEKDEILEALREGIDTLRADIERPRDSNESILSGTGEILDALHDGLTGLRTEVERINNKPVDMTVNYEILDTLKAGLEGVRADIDRLREDGLGDRAIAPVTEGAVITADSLKRNDIENLEVLLTQLRIKVESFESMPPQPAPPAPESLSKDDLANIEEMLRNVHETVSGISGRDHTPDEDAVRREDVVALETLLRNTKVKIDEMDPEQAVKKEHLDSVEAIVAETQSTIHELAAHLEDVPKRDDVNIVESLVREIIVGLEEMKERAVKESDDAEKVTKTDVEAVEAVCHDVKSAIEQMVISDIAALASKEDVKNLGLMVKEFKDRIDIQADTNAKGFEDRQAEIVGVGEKVTEVNTFLEEFRDAIKEKLDEGTTGVEALGKLLENMGETIGQNSNISEDLKQLSELLKAEFEQSNAGVVGAKLVADEKFQQTWDKFDTKIDEKFSELMTKYEDAQISAETKAKLGEEKNAETEAALLGTKAVAEDLKLLIDSLGITLTESVEKMDEASKAVFNRVEDTFTRVEETHADAKAEHQLTRDQVFKTLVAVEDVQSNVTEYHPKLLESIKDVLLIVGQHYDHSKSSMTTIQEKIAEIPPPAPIETPLLRDIPVPEKYDDAQVHEKLDKLVDHMHAAGKSFAQLDMLDQIHQQVMQTAAEVSEFVSAQTQRIANDHEDKEKAVEAATIALEKRIAQKEHVEATVVGLREEEDRLKESVSILKAEQEDLAHQKMRLSADVSSLETALRIRREELHAMEARAEGLERRILEGVIDHSRALLISKSNKGRDAMSRKRVPSHATSTTGSFISNATSGASYTTQSAVSMAMSGNRAVVNVPNKNPAGASRRILSLNQITHNVPAGGFKRSHSVKTSAGAGAMRKSSWGGSLSQKYGDLNKENLALKESEEDENISEDGEESENETMRRSSRGTTILTGTGASESIDEGTEWTGSEDGDRPVEEPSSIVLYEEAGEVV